MRKRLLALLLCVVTVLGLFAAPASAASSEEEALGEIDIYSGGTSPNGHVIDTAPQTVFVSGKEQDVVLPFSWAIRPR